MRAAGKEKERGLSAGAAAAVRPAAVEPSVRAERAQTALSP